MLALLIMDSFCRSDRDGFVDTPNPVNGMGFFVQPADLRGRSFSRRVAVVCPEAFTRAVLWPVPWCPQVRMPSSRILTALLWSLSMMSPQLGQIWVRTERLFWTRNPQLEQSWLV